MPRDKSVRSSWRCDSCGELVTDLQAGWVEWVAAEDTRGKPKVSGLRVVHRRAPARDRQSRTDVGTIRETNSEKTGAS